MRFRYCHLAADSILVTRLALQRAEAVLVQRPLSCPEKTGEACRQYLRMRGTVHSGAPEGWADGGLGLDPKLVDAMAAQYGMGQATESLLHDDHRVRSFVSGA